ncbi:SepM family pheromone-processing serine protease [Cytobacillus purgationiresistens]|uniref:endopeptidase La n=1 Tax=Cytobacillus purgationiresistens TaxID=863449 RepID=A0ABU0AMA1_9BACI|nr:SepM family pheromone-processing serine protease [Cytobacillus purgationiresistens]MDQ0272386.1 PDZ domain-containing protein [Cytobacillus purgationiresistens]
MKNRFLVRSFFVVAILVLLSSFFYLPYYVSKPGMAKELEPIIEVDNASQSEGTFMLTTVRMGKANIYAYLTAKLSKYQKIHPVEEIRREDETDKEYNLRQLHLMDSSKSAAIEVAYQHANIPIHYEYKGVYVLQVMEGMPAEGAIELGDRIIEVDGQKFDSSTEFIDIISKKKKGEKAVLTYERDKDIKEVELTLKVLPQTGKAGVGITLVDDKEIEVEPKVEIDSSEIGGPSAGFMFSLEIYDQLIEEDLTKGYRIAGTGTIAPEGTVGRIGGVEQKVVAADKAGADIFFAPNEAGNKDSNYLAAIATAKDIKTNMKIIPIDTFDEAVDYLLSLDNK